MALADLLRGRTLENALDRMCPLWETLFRVVDDIKESVRKAAQSALRALSKVISFPPNQPCLIPEDYFLLSL